MRLLLNIEEVNAIEELIMQVAGTATVEKVVEKIAKTPYAKLVYDGQEIKSYDDLYAVERIIETEEDADKYIEFKIRKVILPILIKTSSTHLASIYNLGKTFGFMLNAFQASINNAIEEIVCTCKTRDEMKKEKAKCSVEVAISVTGNKEKR